MAARSVPLSVRLPLEDAEFIARLDINGARSPSDKIRAIIAAAREREDRSRDYDGQLRFAEALLSPVMRNLRAREHELGVHSEVVSRLHEWLPELVAFVLAQEESAQGTSVEALAEFEDGVLRRLLAMMQSIMHFALTERAPCYDASIIKNQIQPVLDLAGVVSADSLANRE